MDWDLTDYIQTRNFSGLGYDPESDQCCTTLFLVYCLLTYCDYSTPVPEEYFNPEHRSYNANEGMVYLMHLFPISSEMNFDNRILTAKTLLVLLWYDEKKKNLVSNERVIMIDRGTNETQWQRMINTTYLPDMIGVIDRFNFDPPKYRNDSKLIVEHNGFVRYTEHLTFKINCNQKTVWFPYETYECEQDLWSVDSYHDNSYEMIQWLKMYKDTHFKTIRNNHKMLEFKSRCRFIAYQNDTSGRYQKNCFWKYKLRRRSPKIMSELLPSIPFTILELFAYTLGKNLLIRSILIPGYFQYLRVIDVNKTNLDWHPFAIFLYSRFLSSVFLFSSNFLSLTTTNPRRSRFVRWQDKAWKRFIGHILISCLIAAILTIKLIFFTEDTLIDTHHLDKKIPAPFVDNRPGYDNMMTN